ncbi:hypothetical protein BFP97_14475 [Roseivirga sp. 4D4]|uniref:YkgJ family cysteine cluster protein n=1 Tax=Roseivirga sp. 4D4 TaxID=1889784 RepID=UPI0008532947|nr:YkgJ family cysteine cluster protein [Roseivirga sp. 4D4]OEK02653.1 hypothetical protein BFP97_14475 [Roseivirga sp. 4D4]
MSIISKVKAVEKIFASLDQEITALQTTSGLRCIAGCGKCCFKPDVEATPLEFLPFAFHLYLTNRIEEKYDLLLERVSSICTIFEPQESSLVNGSCSEYKFRGLICRLFGYSAVRNKYGKTSFVTCAPLKTQSPEKVAAIESGIGNGESVPMMNDYYFQIRSVDPDLGNNLLPINQAIRQAMEAVMGYYAYREPPPAPGMLSA